MNVHLTPEAEQIVEQHIRSGRYSSASELISEALHLLEQRDEVLSRQREDIRQKIAEGYESLRRGKGIDGEEFFEQLERKEPSSFTFAAPR